MRIGWSVHLTAIKNYNSGNGVIPDKLCNTIIDMVALLAALGQSKPFCWVCDPAYHYNTETTWVSMGVDSALECTQVITDYVCGR